MHKKLVLACLWGFLSFQAFPQSPMIEEYTLSSSTRTIGQLLLDIRQQSGISFSYKSDLIHPDQLLEVPPGTYSLKEIFKNVFHPLGIQVVLQGKQAILIPMVFSSEPITIHGQLFDSTSLLPLVGATIYLPEIKSGAATNSAGKFSISIRPGPLQVQFGLLGYKTLNKTMVFEADTSLRIFLTPVSIQIKEVVVQDQNQTDPVQSLKIGNETLDIEKVESMPAMFGEVDVMKSLQMLPGVQSAGEGLSGLLVRGGSADQTLVMLNNTTIYSPSHFLGFFSAFNPEAIDQVEVYKGGIPARWGGRISSIINSSLKTGNMEHYKISGGVGLISSRLSVEGPILKNKASFFVSGRRTYFDLLLKAIPQNFVQASSLYFLDLNSAFEYRLNEKNNFRFFTYHGDDVARFYKFMRIHWGNQLASADWLHSFSPNLLLNTSLHYSTYGYGFQINLQDELEYLWRSKLKEYSLRLDFDYSLNRNNRFNFGYNFTRRIFSPFFLYIEESNNPGGNGLRLDEKNVAEQALYFHHEHRFNDRLSIQYGLRYSVFNNLGPDRIFQYQNGEPKSIKTITDTLQYPAGKIFNTYHGPEPRFIGRYSFSDSSSIKVSYNRMRQYTQVASSATASLPTDRWIPSDVYLKPQIGDQWSIGFFSRPKEGFNFSAEVYYKMMRNQLDFKDGVIVLSNFNNQNADILYNNALETQLVSGKGWSYGLELMLNKKQGPFSGWVSYTYARTKRQIEGISKGMIYSPRYDRPHDISLVTSYQWTNRLKVAANWVYTSGSAVTLPEGKYTFEGRQIPYFNPNARNNSRLPNYHRLDLSLTLDQKKNEDRRWKGSWTFSLYNAYMRKNPLLVQFVEVINNDPNLLESEVQEDYDKQLKGVKIYFSLIPAITYNFSF